LQLPEKNQYKYMHWHMRVYLWIYLQHVCVCVFSKLWLQSIARNIPNTDPDNDNYYEYLSNHKYNVRFDCCEMGRGEGAWPDHLQCMNIIINIIIIIVVVIISVVTPFTTSK